MDGSQILAMEFFTSIAVVSVNEIKYGLWPYPPDIMRVAVSYAILGAVAVFQPNFAALLAGGFLIALLLEHFKGGKWQWADPTQMLGDDGTAFPHVQGKRNGAQWWGPKGTPFVYSGVPLAWNRSNSPGNSTSGGTTGAKGPGSGSTVTI